MNRIIFTLSLVLLSGLLLGQHTVTGTVVNEKNETMDFCSVFLKDSEYATSTIQDGSFSLENVKAGTYIIKASFIGYESFEQEIEVNGDVQLDIVLPGTIYQLDAIQINSTQARKENPIVYSTMNREQIEDANIAQDVPYLLRWMPSVTVTSDAGAGIGYTGIRVRGSEASRTNVTINGVPLNDAESQTVFWVDLPDFMSNVENVQLQRGVGVSTNGTSAFGATLHLNTQSVRQNPFAILSGAIGSFGTNKYSAHAGTGIMNGKYILEGRMSWINSNGYIDRASSDLSSYFFSAARVSEGSSLRLNFFSGAEVTYQAWNGLPIQYLDSLRTFNTAGTEKPGEPYDNEVDNYRQTHGQLIYNKNLSQKSTLNVTGYFTSGRGFFENYKANELNADFGLTPDTLVQDIVIQRWLDNLLTGMIYSYEYDAKWVNLIVGGGLSQYVGSHFGDVIWRATDTTDDPKANNYYANKARKRAGNIYVRSSFSIKDKIFPFIDLQARNVNYRYEGPDNNGEILDITDNLFFFNPKAGLSIIPHKNHKFFAFYGLANREPARSEYTGSTPETRPSPETLHDIELGYNARTKRFDVDLTLFNMRYRNQLVPTGKLSDVGENIRTNVDRSFRRGAELGLLLKLSDYVKLGYYSTLSVNKIVAFDEYVDNWDTGEQDIIQHELTDISFSPNQLHTITTNFDVLPINEKHDLNIQANWKYVGSQFLDNTGNENSKLDPFSYLDALINYRTSYKRLKRITLTLQLNNILNQKYVSNGWIYRFRSEGYNPVNDDPYARAESNGFYNLTGLYPQATRNFLLGLKLEF